MGNRPNKLNIRRSNYNDENTFTDAMKTKIPSFNIKYANKLEIKEDKLQYIGEDEQERAWLAQAISVAGILKISYVYENGTEAAPTYEQVIPDGSYEVESPTISGYEPDHYMISGEIQGDTNVTVTYYGESQGLEYEELTDGTYTVAGIGSFTGQNLVIPRKNNDKAVTQIKKEAFKNNKTIIKLIIPNTVLNVGDSCFEGCNLEQLNLNAIQLDGRDQFRDTKLNTVTIGKSVEQVGNRPFFRCTYLTNVEILTDKPNINGTVFNSCNNLKEIKVNEENSKYKVVDKVLYSKDEKIIYMYPPGREGQFEIPRNVEELYKASFFGNKNLTEINIPNSVKKVGDACFEGCSNLEKTYIDALKLEGSDQFEDTKLNTVTIGKNVEQLGNRPFYNCTYLTNVEILTDKSDINASIFNGCKNLRGVKVNEENSKYKVIDGILYSKDEKILYMYPPGREGQFEIPRNVEELYKASFFGNKNLTEINIPNSVKKVKDTCFESCSNLEQLNLNAIQLDGSDQFRTTKLNTVTIGKSVEQLGIRPFYQCNTINEINYLGTINEWNNITKNNIKEGSSLKKINCTDGIIDL